MTNKKIKKYFPGGNTVQGFYSFYEYIPFKTKYTIVIKGGPGTGKSTLMKKIGQYFLNQDLDVEFHLCSSDSSSLDGLVIPAYYTAIFDGTAPHQNDPIYPGAVGEIFDTGQFWNREKLIPHKNTIKKLNNTITQQFNKVYNRLKVAKIIHS